MLRYILSVRNKLHLRSFGGDPRARSELVAYKGLPFYHWGKDEGKQAVALAHFLIPQKKIGSIVAVTAPRMRMVSFSVKRLIP